MDYLSSFFGRSGFLPHGYCITWSPDLLWTMVGSDGAIALSYFSIPVVILSFVRRRRDPTLNLVAALFCAFIFACGLTHVMDVWTIWQPVYGLQALSKLATAGFSMLTAVVLWRLLPQALRIPSVSRLQAAVDELEAEVRKRRSAEEVLIDTQQSLAVTLASIGAGFLAADREGRVIRINEVAERVLGWTDAQARGQLLWEVFGREDRPPERLASNPVDQMILEGTTVETIHRVMAVSRQGLRTPLEVKGALTHSADGSVRGLAMVFRDLTQVVQAEAESRRAEEGFRRVVEAAPSGILMIDRQGRITLSNRRVEDLLGHAPGELIGRPIESLVPDIGDLSAASAPGAAGAAGPGREHLARRSDGSEVPVEIGLNPIETSAGPCTLASVFDITQRKRSEDELRRSNADLEQFAYIASHDLQEPLRMVASYTELLAQKYSGRLDEKADKYIHYAVDGAKRMQRLVKDLLAYSRIGSQGKPLEPVAADRVLDEVLAVLGPALRAAGATLQRQPLPVVLADEVQLGQLFQNLIGNALKFRSEAPPVIAIEAVLQGGRWRFSVRDNGIGLEPRYAERIFQMFQRLHPVGQFEGSGIGLAIVKRILERHGGRIWLDSAPGAGTTFYFTLPPGGAPEAEPSDAPAAVLAAVLSAGTEAVPAADAAARRGSTA